MVTIAIPSYNHSAYVSEALRSLFNQTFRDFEIIIIDDGSDDGSPDVIRRTIQENPGLDLTFEVQKNMGLSATLNKALTMARGEFFAFLPSDDYYHPEKLARQVQVFQNHPSLAVCYTWQNIVDASSNPTTDRNILDWFDLNYVSSYSFFPHLLERNFLAAPSALARTGLLLDKGGFDESLIYLQDHDMWLRLLAGHEGLIIHERLLFYRWHGKNLTFAETPKTLAEKRYVLRKFVHTLTPGSRRVMENRERMRSHLAASCVEGVEELLLEFDRNTSPSRPEAEQEIMGQADYDRESLKEHIRYAEARIYELRNQGAWLEHERRRLFDENESIKAKPAQRTYDEERVAELVSRIHQLRVSRGWKLLRLAQIVRTGLITRDPAVRRLFFRWVLDKVRGRATSFAPRPDPLALVDGLTVEPLAGGPEPVSESVRPAKPLDFKIDSPGEALWLMEPVLPLASILMPVYNHASLLPQAVESALAQDYPNIELIILDDGSTDDVEAALEPYVSNLSVRIYRQENQGLPRALTRLHQLARGEFITWTSADNLMGSSMVSTLAATLLERPDAVMAFGDPSLIDEQGQPYRKGTYRPHNVDSERPHILRLHREDAYLGLEPDNYINAAFLYRAQAVQVLNGRFDHRLPGLEDYDFWLRLQKAGVIVHARNREPVYRYRVHEDTMSKRLLERDPQGHYERTQLLMEAEAARSFKAAQCWSVVVHSDLDSRTRSELKNCCRAVAADWMGLSDPERAGAGKPIAAADKVMNIVPASLPAEGRGLPSGTVVLVSERFYELSDPDSDGVRRWGVKVPRGVSISPLAKKARQWVVDPGDRVIRKAENRPVVGIHTPPVGYQCNFEYIRRAMKDNPDLFFVLLATSEHDWAREASETVEGLENAAFAGVEPFGKPYQVYAAWNVIWLPPLVGEDGASEQALRLTAALSYSVGIWLLHSTEIQPIEWIPFSLPWHPESEGSKPVFDVAGHSPDVRILDRLLQRWTPEGRIHQVLALADAGVQDRGGTILDRLDADAVGMMADDRSLRRWPAQPKDMTVKNILFQVDRLGYGGLERTVVLLAQELYRRGRNAAVLCAHELGPLANEIQSKGVPVYCPEGNIDQYRLLLEKIKPQVLNTQHSFFGLETASNLDIPVVATIQNMYVWYTPQMWEDERERFRVVHHFIAVSRMVKDYYLKRMSTITPNMVSVAPNCLNPELAAPPDRAEARERLGLGPDDFLFLSLATYDGRKNQLGLLTAFDLAASRDSSIRLLCAGEVASPEYFDLVKKHLNTLKSQDRVELREYETDVAALLGAADGFVIPSYFEGWSLSATEALGAGLPLIHTRCGSASELCGEHGERGEVVGNPGGDPLELNDEILYQRIYDPNPPHTEEMAEALNRISTGREHWIEQKRGISRYCRRAFSLESCANGYERVFSSLTAGKKK